MADISLCSWIFYGEVLARLKLGLGYSAIILGATCVLRLPASSNKAELSPLPAHYRGDSLAAQSCFFFSRQLQGKGCDILKGSSYCLILQELQVHEDGLDLLGAGSWHHPVPGKAWGGDGCNANDGENNTFGTELGESGICITLHGVGL